jgi:hypothetical protein
MRERKFVKLRVDMYEDTKFKMIDRMEQRDLIHYIWTRLIALAGKSSRRIIFIQKYSLYYRNFSYRIQ